MSETNDLKKYVRDIPDFPKEGILFRDISPLLANPKSLHKAIEELAAPYVGVGIDYVAAAEARGFIFGSAIADKLGAGFIPIRKPGKLPGKTNAHSYDLEYGQDSMEIHVDAINPGSKVIIVDDLLATGGTMSACCKLIEGLGGEIAGLTFLIELVGLGGRAKFDNYCVHSVLKFDVDEPNTAYAE